MRQLLVVTLQNGDHRPRQVPLVTDYSWGYNVFTVMSQTGSFCFVYRFNTAILHSRMQSCAIPDHGVCMCTCMLLMYTSLLYRAYSVRAVRSYMLHRAGKEANCLNVRLSTFCYVIWNTCQPNMIVYCKHVVAIGLRLVMNVFQQWLQRI